MAQLPQFREQSRINEAAVVALVSPPPHDIASRALHVQEHVRKPRPESWRHENAGARAMIPWQGQRGRVISNFFMVRNLQNMPTEVARFHVRMYSGPRVADGEQKGEQKGEERKVEPEEDIVDKMDKEALDVAVAETVAALELGRFAYDGTRELYIAVTHKTPPLIQHSDIFQTVRTLGNRTVMVHLRRENSLSTTFGQVMEEFLPLRQLLDLVLRQHIVNGALQRRWWMAGQRAVFPSHGVVHLDSTAAILAAFGFSLGWKVTRAGLALNRDFTVGVFLKGGKLLEVMAAIANSSVAQLAQGRIDHRLLKNMEAYFKNAKIKTTHTGFSKKFKEFRGPASDERFVLEGRTITVAAYFQQRYGALQYPNALTVNVGSRSKPVLIPAEMVEIVEGQSRNNHAARLELTSEIIRHSAKQPNERMQHIQHGDRDILNSLVDPSGVLGAFGLSDISDEPMPVDAVVLPAARLQYRDGVVHPEHKGEWEPTDASAQRLQFVDGKQIHYHVACFADRRNAAERDTFFSSLERVCRTHGVRLVRRNPRVEARSFSGRSEEFKHQFQAFVADFATTHPRDLLIVILAEKRQHMLVKSCADARGILTQCILQRTCTKLSDATLLNLCTKINAKCGGINHTLASRANARSDQPSFQSPPHSLGWMFQQPCMVVGIDVSHPEPGSTHASTAAVVASMDRYCVQYAAHLSAQTSRQEMVSELANAMTQLLDQFRDNNEGHYPKHIIVYRDGVSEGQFDAVLEHELIAIQHGVEQCGLMLGPEPDAVKLAIVVCQKRHKTRLVFEESPGSFVNLSPGVVVDGSSPEDNHDITSAQYLEFYLNSHVSIQGTAKPCRYTLIYDSLGFKLPELQTLTFWLCHLYSRCNRSVSYPTPAYYAHWASKRASELQAAGGARLQELCRTWSVVGGPSMYFI